MANGNPKIKKPKETKLWKVLSGTYKRKTREQKAVERLICAIQQELEFDDRDLQTFTKIQHGYLDWSGNVRSKRRTRKHIRKRS